MKRSTSMTIAVLLLVSLLSIIYSVEAENFILLGNGVSSFAHNGIPIKGEESIPVGVNVTVHPASDLELIFSNVTAEGYVTANKTSAVEAPPLVDLVAQYYDIRVTASYFGNVMVSLVYDDSNMTQQRESFLTMMQYIPILGDAYPFDYGRVNIMDITFIAKCFGSAPGHPRWNAAADTWEDAVINILDLALCAKHFGETTWWMNITTYVDTELNIVRGETTHFSFIGIH